MLHLVFAAGRPLASASDTSQIRRQDRLSSPLKFCNRLDFLMALTIDVYTKAFCPFCTRAKGLLTSKGAEFNEYDITMGGAKRAEMMERAPNARTVPQIFIGDTYVGGSDELAALEAQGKLDTLLAG